MYQLVESRAKIAQAQKKLEATMKREFAVRETKDIGWPSGRQAGAKLFANGRFWYWTSDHDIGGASPRRLNWFGVYGEGPGVSISAEINTPYQGRNDRVAGFFARDTDNGTTYLFHTGRVGGGAKGVGKDKFLAYAGYKPIEIFDSEGQPRYGVIVMPVDGAGATRSTVAYVQTIVDFKKAVRDGKADGPDIEERERQLRDYYTEAFGRRTGKRLGGDIDYVSRHGEVVEALSVWRTSQGLARGTRLVKNVLIDLGIKRSGKLVEVYEVKTSVGRGDVYKAIGQLAVHAPDDDCKRVIVLPQRDALAKDLKDGLARNGIELMRFDLTETEAKIL